MAETDGVTLEQVLGYLSCDEPDYKEAEKLGQAALPHLKAIVLNEKKYDGIVVPAAVALAGMIGAQYDATNDALRIIDLASRSTNVYVRLAAAGALKYLDVDRDSEIVIRLLNDNDAGVRQITERSLRKKSL